MRTTINLLIVALGMCMLWGTVTGCGGAPVERDPKALAEEAARLDKKVAEGEKGL